MISSADRYLREACGVSALNRSKLKRLAACAAGSMKRRAAPTIMVICGDLFTQRRSSAYIYIIISLGICITHPRNSLNRPTKRELNDRIMRLNAAMNDASEGDILQN